MSFDDFAASRGLERAPGWAYKRSQSGQMLGYLRVLPSGCAKAMCRRHADCSYFVNALACPSQKRAIWGLIAWLAEGMGCDTKAAHDDRKGGF